MKIGEMARRAGVTPKAVRRYEQLGLLTPRRKPNDSFDAAMTTFSVHQWSDLKVGLLEMRRVATGPVVVLTCDPDRVREFWLYQYAPLVLETEARRYPGNLYSVPAASLTSKQTRQLCVRGADRRIPIVAEHRAAGGRCRDLAQRCPVVHAMMTWCR